MNLELITFVLYLVIAAHTTIFIGRSLYNNGSVFLKRIFRSTPNVAMPVNKLLLVGFYLVNLGFILAFISQKTTSVESILQGIEFLSLKLGIVYVILGGMHLFNLMVFIIIEKKINLSNHKKI